MLSRIRRFFKNNSLAVFLLYAVLAGIAYADVAFFNRSLVSYLFYPQGRFSAPDHADKKPLNVFNIDFASNAFYEEPINRLTGSMYALKQLPLWNPYQGCGTPLAAQYSTRVYFPYQILENAFPNTVWDYFLLGRLVIGAFFTFLFLRSLGLRGVISFLGGVFYMFSGSLVWFVNNEQLMNSAMSLPIAAFFVEKLAARGAKTHIAISAFAIGLALLAGQPESAAYILLFLAVYYGVRVFAGRGMVRSFAKRYLKFAIAVFLGAGLAAIVIVPFLELASSSYHCHPAGGAMGSTEGIVPAGFFIGTLVPYLFELPTHYRYFPHNGIWDYLGGYCGVLAAYLTAMGFFLRRKAPSCRLFLFFSLFSFGLLLKNFGFPPLVLIGRLPLLDQSWSPRWASFVWTFSLACAAAVALQMITDNGVKKKAAWLAVAAFVCAVFIYYYCAPLWTADGLFRELLKVDDARQFLALIPLRFLIGVMAGVVFAGAAAYLLWRYEGKGELPFALCALSIGELLIWIPKGLGYPWREAKIISLTILVVAAAFSLARRKILPAAAIAVAAIVISVVMDIRSPNGLPRRRDIFAAPDFVKFLHAQYEKEGYYRFMQGERILMPNFASAFRVFDVGYINSLSPFHYQHYVDHCLLAGAHEAITDRLWFTGIPDIFKPVRRTAYEEFADNEIYYSFLGVKYLLAPKDASLRLPLVYDREIRIYENPSCFPRAYVVNRFKRVRWQEEAQLMIKQLSNEVGYTAFVEKAIPPPFNGADTRPPSAEIRIVDYQPNSVTIDVETEKAGMLVLTDLFYPGWKAFVDGRPVEIFKVNGLMRGVLIDESRHTVRFFYSPASFKAGLLITSLSALSCIFLALARPLPEGKLHAYDGQRRA